MGQPTTVAIDEAREVQGRLARASGDGAADTDTQDGDALSDDSQPLKLPEMISTLLEEARIVLPGVQALFGFQLMVVFSEGFQTQIGSTERTMHLGAIVLVAIAVGLLVTPAAYHRQVEPESASRSFVRFSSRLLWLSTIPLMLAIAADVYVVAVGVTGRSLPGIILSLCLLLFFASLWIVLPRTVRARRRS